MAAALSEAAAFNNSRGQQVVDVLDGKGSCAMLLGFFLPAAGCSLGGYCRPGQGMVPPGRCLDHLL
jgi:hypothetical protein